MAHSKHTLFPTDIYQVDCDINVDQLYERCLQHQEQVSTVTLSNRGGYQGHHFDDHEFTDLIFRNMPTVGDKPLDKISLQAWVNINGPGHWNTLHNHLDEQCLISGIFYVRCPTNSGNLYIYDPRFLSNTGVFYRYYHEHDMGYMEWQPKPNLLLFFPPSLWHMVGPNMSDQTRCSIAFNILVAPASKF